MRFEKPPEGHDPVLVSAKKMAYLGHLYLYRVHQNPKKCVNYLCGKCKEIHLCPALN